MSFDNVVTGVTIETALFPPITLDHPLASGDTPNPFLQLLKPKITVTTPFSSNPRVIAPYGDPGDAWQLADLFLMAGIAVAAGFVLRKIL